MFKNENDKKERNELIYLRKKKKEKIVLKLKDYIFERFSEN